MIGLNLGVIAAINIVDKSTPNSDGQINESGIDSDYRLRKTGSLVMSATFGAIVGYGIYVWNCIRQALARQSQFGTLSPQLLPYVTLVMSAAPFIGTRALYGIIYSFDYKNKDLNPMTGSFAVKLIFIVILQLGAVVCFLVGGWKSINVAREMNNGGRYETLNQGQRYEAYRGQSGNETGSGEAVPMVVKYRA